MSAADRTQREDGGAERDDIQPGDQLWRLDDQRFGGRCIIVKADDTRESLLAAGMTAEGADEVMRFRAFLEAKGRGEFVGSFKEWPHPAPVTFAERSK